MGCCIIVTVVSCIVVRHCGIDLSRAHSSYYFASVSFIFEKHQLDFSTQEEEGGTRNVNSTLNIHSVLFLRSTTCFLFLFLSSQSSLPPPTTSSPSTIRDSKLVSPTRLEIWPAAIFHFPHQTIRPSRRKLFHFAFPFNLYLACVGVRSCRVGLPAVSLPCLLSKDNQDNPTTEWWWSESLGRTSAHLFLHFFSRRTQVHVFLIATFK